MKRAYKILFMAALILCLCVSVAAEGLPVLIDQSSLLTQQEAELLSAELERIRDETGCDIVVLTTDSLDGKSAEAYADDYYDYNGYGDDGMLLLVSMAEREWWISTCGSCMYIDVDMLGERFVPFLSRGSYYDAFYRFAADCQSAITGLQDDPYSGDSYYESDYDSYEPSYTQTRDPGKTFLICLLVGVAVGLIAVLIMKGQLKSVRKQSGADRYVGAGGLNLTIQTDRFLYQNVSRRAKPQQNTSGGGGGGFHVSSSGRSHGGGGGRF